MGIDKKLSSRAQKLVATKDFDERLTDWRLAYRDSTERVSRDLLNSKHVRGTFGTGEYEWYTPAKYIVLARMVLGQIDLDPASSEQANSVVKAGNFYTAEANGLKQPWYGNVWLNPPYSQPLIAEFAEAMTAKWQRRQFKSAIVLTHNYTDTGWFQNLFRECSAICFPAGRIKFIRYDGHTGSPTQGQAFTYFGDRPNEFRAIFGEIGGVR